MLYEKHKANLFVVKSNHLFHMVTIKEDSIKTTKRLDYRKVPDDIFTKNYQKIYNELLASMEEEGQVFVYSSPKLIKHKIREDYSLYDSDYYLDMVTPIVIKRLKRDILLEKLNKLDGKKSLWGKFVRVNERKNQLIDKHIDSYFAYFEKHFNMLQLNKEIYDKLKMSFQFSLKFDLIQPLVVLDEIVEKIEEFNQVVTETKYVSAADCIYHLKGDFESFIQEIIIKLNNEPSVVLDADESKEMNEIRNKLFKA